MVVVETTSDHNDGEALAHVAIELEHDANTLLVELMQRTGWDASELVAGALGAYQRELEGVVLPPPQPEEDVETVLAESEADVDAGRTSSNQAVFARIAAKHGW